MHNKVLGVDNRRGGSKSMLSSVRGLCLALLSKEEVFSDISGCLTTRSAYHDAYNSKIAGFLWTTTTMMMIDEQTKLLAHVHRVNMGLDIQGGRRQVCSVVYTCSVCV